MDRRKFIASSATAGAVVSTGCLGYTIESEDDVEQWQERIDELESEREHQRERADELESDREELQNELDSIRTERDELTEQITTNDKQGILDTYELVEDMYDQAESDLTDGESFFENENYATASIRYAYAQGLYEQSEMMLDELVDPADEYSVAAGNLIAEEPVIEKSTMSHPEQGEQQAFQT